MWSGNLKPYRLEIGTQNIVNNCEINELSQGVNVYDENVLA